tara:strand:+ start:999 stop:1394 length:396 start_codon:yes stop_codon:yes gene_type:complete
MERKTLISSTIIKFIKKSNTPVSFHDIKDELLTKNLNPNKSTIYRIIDKLLIKKEISQITSKTGTNYYENNNNHHHHHFICNTCKNAFCLKSCHIHSLNINLNNLLPNSEFQIESHDFNLYGKCDKCSNKD